MKPKGLSVLPGLPRKLPTPLPTFPNGFLSWEMQLGPASGGGQEKEEASDLGLGSGLASALALTAL